MSVTIRLSRTGRKNLPSYRLVATQTRSKRDGKVLDIIGHFNPSNTPVSFDYDKKKYMDWVSKGAIVSDAVKKLIEGNYEYIKYQPNKKTEEKAESAAEDTQTAEKAVVESPAAVEETPAEAPADETTEAKSEETAAVEPSAEVPADETSVEETSATEAAEPDEAAETPQE